MHQKTIVELSKSLQFKEISSLELTNLFLSRIQQSPLNAIIHVCEEHAIAHAKAADEQIQKGQASVLTGIPIVHKDIFCTKGIKTTCGSKMLESFIAPYESTVSAKLNQVGAVLIGKANMDEFAMGSSNENSYFGAVDNPWNRNKIPGGSSGGSAACVAARLAPLATGTDTGGSIRQPAALCGVTGFKPTYGTVSRFGMIAFASSLDQGGPITQTAEDAAIVLNAIAGFDEKDSTSVNRIPPDFTTKLEQSIMGKKIGIPKEFFSDGLDSEIASVVETALNQYQKLGATLVDVSLPKTVLSIPTYYVIASAECSSNLSRYDGVRFGYRADAPVGLEDLYKRSRQEGFGSEVKRRIMTGTYVLSAGYYDAYYLKAQKLRRLIQNDFACVFDQVDIIMGPVTPDKTPDKGHFANSVSMYLSDIYTLSVNLAGLPAMSIPAGFAQNMPVGLQLIGKHFDDQSLLNFAHQFQLATNWHKQAPPDHSQRGTL